MKRLHKPYGVVGWRLLAEGESRLLRRYADPDRAEARCRELVEVFGWDRAMVWDYGRDLPVIRVVNETPLLPGFACAEV